MLDAHTGTAGAEETLLKSDALQRAILSSASFSSIATDAQGVIQTFNVGAERMLSYAARDAIDTAPRELPNLIVLDLMMPEVNGFDVVEALKEDPEAGRIPILVVTAKQITAEDRSKLNGFVTTIMEKGTFDPDRFTAEVRRAMSGRHLVA